ncbi:MAG: hypothetical protein H8E03_01205 [Pelagibacteraceae bacterium]|nr:hypothetical protein [Pelagibacteraceae bacterium]
MPYKLSELKNVPLYRKLRKTRIDNNFNKIMDFVNNTITETNQIDELYPIITNDDNQLIYFQSGSGENYDENWQKTIVKNISPDIDASLISLYIDTTFEEF